jgi:two-component system, cell cycle sensor histidine kinase and response regulator CckA
MMTHPEDFQQSTPLHQRIAELEALVVAHQQQEHTLREQENSLGALQRDYEELERRMQERTAELVQANQLLQREINKRKQTEAEIVQRNGQLLTLQAAGAAISSSLDLQYILNTVTHEMTNLLGVDSCTLSDWNKSAGTVQAIAGFSHSFWWNDVHLGQVFHLADYPLTRQVLVEQRPQQIRISEPDVDLAEAELMKATEIKALLMLPMIFKEQVVGLIELIETEFERTFTRQEIALAQFLANQAAGAIENARLYQAQQAIAIENAGLHQQAQQEIAERKRAEAAANVAHDTLRRLIQQLPIGVQIFDTSGLCVDANQAHMRIFGIKHRDQVVGKFNLFEDRLAEVVGTGAAGRKALSGQTVHLPEVLFDFRKADSRFTATQGQRVLSVTFFPVRDYHDDIVQIVALNEDITERKRTEVTLMLERERMSSTLKSIGDGVLALNAEGDILLTNPMGEAYLKTLIAAENAGALISKDNQSLVALLTFAPKTRVSYELVRAGLSRQVFEIVKQPLETESQTGDQVVVIRDITEARLAQERNQQQERLVAVGQLAAGIAHDFNNILTSVIGFAELLQLEPNLAPSAISDLQRIVQQGQRGAHLIRQILDFARQTIATKHSIDLAPFIRETIELLERTIPENIRMVVDIEPGQYLLNADPTQMQQVLTNLAVNAWDAMPTGGALRFGLAHRFIESEDQAPHPGIKAGPWIVLSVSDTGMGMSPEVQAHIFEPFFTTKPVDKGTGLGLSQVDGIVKQHEGQIYVDSEVGQGTTFTLYLPPLAVGSLVYAHARNGEVSRGQNQTILLVEDNLSVLKVTQKMLQRLGYQILTATNGRAALEVYEQHQQEIALILADSTMPIMGGLDLAQALHDRNPAIKVVVITGYPLRDESKELLSRGVINWLQKPLHFEQLAQAISQALET